MAGIGAPERSVAGRKRARRRISEQVVLSSTGQPDDLVTRHADGLPVTSTSSANPTVPCMFSRKATAGKSSLVAQDPGERGCSLEPGGRGIGGGMGIGGGV